MLFALTIRISHFYPTELFEFDGYICSNCQRSFRFASLLPIPGEQRAIELQRNSLGIFFTWNELPFQPTTVGCG